MDPLTAIDSAAFPRVARYLASLPSGIRSYPGHTSKASIQRPMLARHPVDLTRGRLPDALVGFIRDPPPASTWVPTVIGNAAELAVADTHCDRDEQFVELARQMNVELLSSRLYRIMIYVMSPGFLLKQAAGTWKHFHKGTHLHTLFVDKSAELTLTFPLRLHPELVVLEKGTAFRAALEAAGARDVRLDVIDWDATSARYAARWE